MNHLLASAVLVAALFPAPAQAPRPSTLVDVRAAHHAGLDRLVFEFNGGLPARRTAGYVAEVIGDGSGKPVGVVGDAFLWLSFASATGHDDRGTSTYGKARRTYALPGLIQVVNAGDFETTLSFGLGLSKRVPYRMYTLSKPDRIVVDLKIPYRTVLVRDHLLDTERFNAGREPYTKAVLRPVIAPATAYGALQRLFAGPTQAEYADGLRFTASGATGFSKVTVRDRIARVHLKGACDSRGATFTVADEIRPTLKRFPSIHWVKIYDSAGHSQRPSGRSDSIPTCLEP